MVGRQKRQRSYRRRGRLETQVWRLVVWSAVLAPSLDAQARVPHLSVDATPATTAKLPDSAVTWITLRPQPGNTREQLPQLIKAEIRRAIARGMTPFLEVGAAWCAPCIALEESLRTAEMIEAFRGAYIIHLDLDDWNPETDFPPVGIHSNDGIPFIEGIDTTGHVTSQDDDDMDAPGIKRFLATHMWHRTPRKAIAVPHAASGTPSGER